MLTDKYVRRHINRRIIRYWPILNRLCVYFLRCEVNDFAKSDCAVLKRFQKWEESGHKICCSSCKRGEKGRRENVG